MLSVEGLTEVRTYAAGIGVHKSAVLPVVEETWTAPTGLIDRAHAADLVVHAYTFRNEPGSLPAAHPVPAAEVTRFLELGVDGLFADHPDTAISARAAWSAREP